MQDYERNAQYECMKCKHGWVQKSCPTVCPKCKHTFVRWLNHPLTLASSQNSVV